jgi:prepilin signal peptidase PulO-like enzyme (type II secretory pathway)
MTFFSDLAALPPVTYMFGPVLAGILLALSWVDLREFRLPDPLNFSLIVIGLIWSALAGNGLAALIGAIAGYLSFVTIAWVFRRLRGIDGLGRGDAKLLAGGGAWCGWAGLPLIVLIASLLGIAMALTAPLWQTAARAEDSEQDKAPDGWIPFGPCLAAAIFAVWTAGQIVPNAF